ncbi:MFS transporter [Halostella sp. JP-L12]|uniref:MFS transporter n=1 Tax=Halostella TaxID=1843185 RepID=UPI000EF7E840|nr:MULTISPECIES: MFS transporter [Halostella]NHN47458.1 MFS transporter [Halostella sp. JP-L12]
MVFLVNLARVVFAPLVEPLRTAFGFSGGTIGLVVTMTWVGSALPRLPTGYLLTKVPRHSVVFGSGALLTAAAAITAVADSFYALAAGALLMGVTSGAYFIAANPLVSELFPDRVGRAIGVHGMSSQLAAVGAPLVVGGVLAVADWRAVFWLISAVAGATTAVFFLIARRAEMPSAGTKDRAVLAALRRQWPIIVTGVAIIGATGFVWNGVFNFYVTYLVEAKDLGEPMARNALTAVFAAGVPAFVLTGRIAERIAYVPLMLSILGAFVAALLALTVVQGLAAVLLVSLILGYVIHSLFPALDTYLLDSLPDENRASAYSLYSASMMLVQATGSAALGGLTDAGVAFDAVFRGYAVALVAVLVVLLVLYAAGRLPSEAAPA